MDINTKRRDLCEKCLIISGIDSSQHYGNIRVHFPDSLNGEKLIPPGEGQSSPWILLFPNTEVVEKYIGSGEIVVGEKSVNLSRCECPCDIPQEWLSDTPNTAWTPHRVQNPQQGFPYAPFPAYPYGFVPPGFFPDKQLLEMLNDMGIPKNDSIKGLYYTGNRNVESAANWIIDNQGFLKNPMPQPQPPFPIQQQWPGYQPQQFPQACNFPAAAVSSPKRNVEQSSTTTKTTVTEQGIRKNRETQRESNSPEISINEHSKEQYTMIKVTKLPAKTTEDNLTLFFENTRRSGGGDITNVEYNPEDGTAIITFQEDNVVESVLAKSPLLFMNTTIDVERYIDKQLPLHEPSPRVTSVDSSKLNSLTVEVRGVKQSTQEITVQYYFESKKGADDDVINIIYVEENDVYRLTFASEDAVAKVLEKQHSLEGTKINVKLYIPPETYPNKVLVQGLPEAVTEEELTNYMESRTRLDVNGVDFSVRFNDSAVVTFGQDIDVAKIQESCDKKTFQKTHLKIKPVVVSNCIIVTDFSEKTTESSLEYYFDNKRRSGVEHVEKVQMEDNYCLIYFQKPEDAENACKCPHTIDKSTLTVQVYYECLGPPFAVQKREENVISTDKEKDEEKDIDIVPIFVEDIDPYKMKCLIHSEKLKGLIQKSMVGINSRIVWPPTEIGFISIECTLQKGAPGYKDHARDWTEKAKYRFRESLDALKVEHRSTLNKVWFEVEHKIRLLFNGEANDLDVILLEQTCDIYIAGPEYATTKLSKKIENIIEEQNQLLQRENEKIEETISLQDHQQQILEALHFTTDILNSNPDIDIGFSMGKPGLNVKGSVAEINDVKSKMLEHFAQIQQFNVGPLSDNYIRFVEDTDIQTVIDNEIKASGHIGVWSVLQNTLTIYTLSHAASMAIRRIFNENIKETTIPIDEQSKSLLKSREWRKLRESIQEDSSDQGYYTRIQELSDNSLSLVCTSRDELENVKEKIRDFMFENSISDQTLPFTKQQMKILKDRYKDKIDLVSLKLENMKVKVRFQDSCIVITGNKKARKDAMRELDPIFKVLKQNVTKDEIQPFAPFGLGHGSVVASFNAEEGQSIMVLCCDMTELGVDAIVSPADHQLSCSGGLSKTIAEEGGQTIIDQCNYYRRQHGRLNEGEVFASKPGNLKCKAVIHAVGPVWQNLQSNEDQVLTDCVHAILRESDKRRYESVAIPALSCGAANYPIDEAVKTIVYAVDGYFKDNASSVKTVYFCDVAAKVTDLFVVAGTRTFKRSRKQLVNQDFSQKPGSVATYVSQIKVVIQDLAKMQVNAIVNTTSTDLNLNKSGAVSLSLIKHGGITIQQQCQRSYPSGIQYGQVAVTSGGKLQCQLIFHGALPQYERDGSSLKILRQFINQCMITAQGRGSTSIAFPSIGTGQLCYPPGQVADVMFDTVAKYYQSYPGYNPQEVYFCLYHRDFTTVQAFQDEEARRNPNKGNSRRKDRL